LESVCRGNSTVGSNPTLSAILLKSTGSSLAKIHQKLRAGDVAGHSVLLSDAAPARVYLVETSTKFGCTMENSLLKNGESSNIGYVD
jgi:hypothetical protein